MIMQASRRRRWWRTSQGTEAAIEMQSHDLQINHLSPSIDVKYVFVQGGLPDPFSQPTSQLIAVLYVLWMMSNFI